MTTVATKRLPLRVGMVAGLDPRKGHLDFVAAAAQVCAQRRDVEFCIVGSTAGAPDYLNAIERSIAQSGLADRFRLVGAVAQVEPWVRSFDVYCVPSLSEALSVAGLEAMALERPIVATRVGGNPEQVDDGITGLLCSPGAPHDLAEKILVLLGDPKRRADMGVRAAARAGALFSIEKNVALLDVALTRAVASTTHS
ncbi:MAG: glycosyltransferase [Polyangiaceae bacterium]|nr:glycosyltransferase [Polyangiaceae bacterium]